MEYEDIDKILGRRLCRRREALGISQEKLGNLVGVTFSQIQKYENASNQIRAARLYDIARHLRISIDVLFRDMESASSSAPNEELEMMRDAFDAIEEPRVKKQVLRLIRSIAESHAA